QNPQAEFVLEFLAGIRRWSHHARVPHSGTKELSPAFQGWESGVNEPESRRDARERLPKHKSRIVGNTRFLQHRQELLLEAPFRVMFRLPTNVVHHCLALRLAHAEGAVSLLPRKTGRLIQPS